MNPKARLLAALDHTRLGTDDLPADIRRLCAEAATGAARPAAVCVHSQFAGLARSALDAGGAPEIAVAVVANFPEGGIGAARPLAEIRAALAAGAAEFDLVFPWRAWLAGDRDAALGLLEACREASAIAAGVAAEGRAFRIAETAVWATGPDGKPLAASPCGGCRQRIREFAVDGAVMVHFPSEGGAVRTATLDELLPHAFTLPATRQSV